MNPDTSSPDTQLHPTTCRGWKKKPRRLRSRSLPSRGWSVAVNVAGAKPFIPDAPEYAEETAAQRRENAATLAALELREHAAPRRRPVRTGTGPRRPSRLRTRASGRPTTGAGGDSQAAEGDRDDDDDGAQPGLATGRASS